MFQLHDEKKVLENVFGVFQMTLMLFNNNFINNNLLFLEPEWAHSESRRLKAEWAIDSEAMRARGIIVLVKSN